MIDQPWEVNVGTAASTELRNGGVSFREEISHLVNNGDLFVLPRVSRIALYTIHDIK